MNPVYFLLRESDHDFLVVDLKGLDTGGGGIVFELFGDKFQQVLSFEVSEPSIGEGNAPDGEIIENKGGNPGLGLDEKAGFGFDRLATKNGGVVGDVCIESGVDGVFP